VQVCSLWTSTRAAARYSLARALLSTARCINEVAWRYDLAHYACVSIPFVFPPAPTADFSFHQLKQPIHSRGCEHRSRAAYSSMLPAYQTHCQLTGIHSHNRLLQNVPARCTHHNLCGNQKPYCQQREMQVTNSHPLPCSSPADVQ
jgi:hypothetical protein